MARTLTRLHDLVIASGETASAAIDVPDGAHSLMLFGPAALTGTVTVQVQRPSEDAYCALQSGGSDVTQTAASKATSLYPINFKRLRLVSGSAEAAARTFEVWARYPA